MKKLAFVIGLLAATSAHAQSFTTGSINGAPFHAFTTTGPTGFGAGFASAFVAARRTRAAMMEADAAERAAELNSPYGRCVTMQANAIMHQKRLPPADVVHAKMGAARAYCQQAFAH